MEMAAGRSDLGEKEEESHFGNIDFEKSIINLNEGAVRYLS